MAGIGQTIKIINKSGKVVNTSKHLQSLFEDAKAAYNERKAEILSSRRDDRTVKELEPRTRRKMEALTLDDEEGRSMRRANTEKQMSRGAKSIRSKHDRSRNAPRGSSDYDDDCPECRAERAERERKSQLRNGSVVTMPFEEPRVGEIARRHTDGPELGGRNSLATSQRTSLEDVDLDLAYGELPPPLPARNYDDEVELRAKMSGAQRLLDEFNCLQHSLSATMTKLQKNPDAMAAVALTLAEISGLAARMAPGALTAMKGSFPTVVALLASPEFAIAVGVAAGVTIIAFGGYKIIKKIKGNASNQPMLENGIKGLGRPQIEDGDDELRELTQIERWRRGIANAEAESLGTIVDGEFITPRASRTLIESGQLAESDLKPKSTTSTHRKRRAKTSRSEATSSRTKTRSKTASKTGSKVASKEQPSGLRMFFKTKN